MNTAKTVKIHLKSYRLEKHIQLNFSRQSSCLAADVLSLYPSMDRNLIRISITSALKQFFQWSYKYINTFVQIVMLRLDNYDYSILKKFLLAKKWYCLWRK